MRLTYFDTVLCLLGLKLRIQVRVYTCTQAPCSPECWVAYICWHVPGGADSTSRSQPALPARSPQDLSMSPLGRLHMSMCRMLQRCVHHGALSSYTSMQTFGHQMLTNCIHEPGTLTYGCGPGNSQLAGHEAFQHHSLSSSQQSMSNRPLLTYSNSMRLLIRNSASNSFSN